MGAGPSSVGDGEPISAINVTPFVDVVLVLLVIFMITAPVLMREKLNFNLPKASSSDTQVTETLGVAVTQQGQILLNGRLVVPEQFKAEVNEALQRNPEIQAIIAADEKAYHQDVITAIDLVKSLGVKRFAMQVNKREAETGSKSEPSTDGASQE